MLQYSDSAVALAVVCVEVERATSSLAQPKKRKDVMIDNRIRAFLTIDLSAVCLGEMTGK